MNPSPGSGRPAPDSDEVHLARAVEVAGRARLVAPPNPWVGAVVVSSDGVVVGEGATAAPGGPHAEVTALAAAGDRARGATLYVTLEPCDHHGRTGPCTEVVLSSGVARMVVGITDPDPQVAGRGVARLRAAGLEVVTGVGAEAVTRQLRPYLTHRRTGRPHVIVKLAATLDGRTAAPDGTSRWITGPEARRDVHLLRARSGAVIVGAGTVRADDPELTVRDALPPEPPPARGLDPLRVVLGRVPPGARVAPALEWIGPIDALLDDLGRRGVLQALVEGGPTVAGAFARAGLVDEYWVYLAPALLLGDDGAPLLAGPGVTSMADAWRGRFESATVLGDDVRLVLVPDPGPGPV
jgi:diaminohydroxyphosphoribosylaminopyrimidine deaminase/5-amino-6-(5-phosphoribosylamino)uracil reductase